LAWPPYLLCLSDSPSLSSPYHGGGFALAAVGLSGVRTLPSTSSSIAMFALFLGFFCSQDAVLLFQVRFVCVPDPDDFGVCPLVSVVLAGLLASLVSVRWSGNFYLFTLDRFDVLMFAFI
jgi:hypothetical protein